MKRKLFMALILALLTLALACQAPPAGSNSQETSTPEPAGPEPAAPSQANPPPAGSNSQETSTPEPAGPEPAAPPQANPLVDLAKADLSRRLGVEVGQVKLVSIEEVTWPDGSLGFPKPGMMYIQVLIPGFRMILTQGGQTYEYHTDKGSHVEHGD